MRSAEQISILDVIDALEGPLAVTECTSDDDDTSCSQAGNCNVQDNWRMINEAIRSALAAITLAEMSKPAGASLVRLARSRAESERLRELE
jgi:DNA-binding IscR family transcriptional regulator